MATLSQGSMIIQSAWKQTGTNSGYDSTEQSGSGRKEVAFTVTGGSSTNRVYFVSGTLTSGSSAVINFQSITDACGTAISAVRCFGVRVEWTGNGLSYAPDATDPFSGPLPGTLAFSGTSGVFGYAMTTHDVVDATHRRVVLTNNNSLATAASLTYKFEVFLGS